MIYEFVIAQTLAAVWGGTLLCYALVIGGFTLAMGLGSMSVAHVKDRQSAWFQLLRVEVLLTLVGTLGPWCVLALDPVHWPESFSLVLRVGSFAPCLAIGWYTGKELPLMMEIVTNHSQALKVMACDYLGMFAGSLLFPLLLLPELGVWGTGLLVATINAVAALWILWRAPQAIDRLWGSLQALQFIALLVAWTQIDGLTDFATSWFIHG
ncbi:MAG: hypothetical protein AB7N80_08550 [Bdellovibrionales bacterium]